MEQIVVDFRAQYNASSYLIKNLFPELNSLLNNPEVTLDQIAQLYLKKPKLFKWIKRYFSTFTPLSYYVEGYETLYKNGLMSSGSLHLYHDLYHEASKNFSKEFLNTLLFLDKKKLLAPPNGDVNFFNFVKVLKFKRSGIPFILELNKSLTQEQFDLIVNSNNPTSAQYFINIVSVYLDKKDQKLLLDALKQNPNLSNTTLDNFFNYSSKGFFSGKNKTEHLHHFIKYHIESSNLTDPYITDVHGVIKKIGADLGYNKKDSRGLCNGITHKWIEASLLGEEDKFYKRINKILNEKNVEQQINAVKTKAKTLNKGEKLTEDEIEWLEVAAFYENLTLYQAPQTYEEVYNAKVSPVNSEALSKIAASEKVNQLGGLKSVYSDIRAFSESELAAYLSELGKIANAIKGQEKIVLTIAAPSPRHVIGLSYNIKRREWACMDINQYPPLTTRSTKKIAKQLSKGFEYPPEPNFLFTSVLATETNAQVFAKPFAAFEKKYPCVTKKVKNNPEISAGLGVYAAMTNNKKVIVELAKHNINFNAVDEKTKGTSLYFAVFNGNLDIVKLLINQKADVNAMFEKATPLFIAAQEGKTEIVTYLLQHSAQMIPYESDPTSLREFAKNKGNDQITHNIEKFIQEHEHEEKTMISPQKIAEIMGHQDIVDLFTRMSAENQTSLKNRMQEFREDSPILTQEVKPQ